MPTFSYRARDFSGQQVKGLLEAENREAAVERLREQKLFITAIHEARASSITWRTIRQEKIPGRHMAVFCRQFSTMINAGLPVLTSLLILKEQTESKTLRQVIGQVAQDLQKGETLADAFRAHPKSIPDLMVNMVEAGEVGGVLDEVLSRLAVHFEKEHAMREKVRSAMTYPVVVLCVALLAVIFLLTFVLPAFQGILTNLGVEMPFLTKVILGISAFLRTFWYLSLLSIILFAVGVKKSLATERGRTVWDKFTLKAPVLGALTQKVIISRFARTLGTLLKGGVPILQALEVVKRTAGNRVVAEGISKAQVNIRDGGGMAGPLAECGVFPPMVIQMIAIGEETGVLDGLLEKLSDFYDGEVDNMVSRLSSIIEPLMILFLGGIVGFIILAILLPMFKIIGSI